MTVEKMIHRCTPRTAKRLITKILAAGLVPFIQSSPGMGKSAITRLVAKEFMLKLLDHRLSTSEPTDLTGLPWFKDGYAAFAPFRDLFPLDDQPLPEGYEGWLLFLDEFNSAPKSVQAAAYKLILDRMVGQHNLHPNVVIVAAGNLSTDRAIVNALGTAMQSRLVHIEMVLDFGEWLEDVAITEGYDPRIIAFLSQYPSKLMDFDPKHQEKTFCCPRTWEFMNKLVKNEKVIKDEDAPMYAGTITSGVATEFITYSKIFEKLVTVTEILKDPTTARLPDDTAAKWATIATMMEHIDEENFDKLATYANRFDLSFRVLFYRATMVRKPDLRAHPKFAASMGEIARYLSGK
ncbi:hypothetical protein D3C76_27500 [compost metagenome]